MTSAAVATPTPPTGSLVRDGPRDAGIDALRASVTLLVIFHHAALTYGAIGGWYHREVAPSATPGGLLLILFCTVNQAWFMGLFFLLAGTYTPSAYRHRGALAFLRDRLIRLGVPLLAYLFLLHPATVALAGLAKGHAFLDGFARVWRRGAFEPGPLWFAEALLIFAAAWLLLGRLGADQRTARPFPSDAMLLSAALGTGAAAFLLRLAWPVGTTVGSLQLGYFASYVVLFAAGCAGSPAAWLERIPPERTRRWLRIAWVALPVFPAAALLAPHLPLLGGRAEGGWSLLALVYAVWEPFVAWGFILGLLTAFRRRVATLTPLWQRLARRAYLIFIIHPPVLVAVTVAARSVALPAVLKAAASGTVACALCYGLAGLLLRVPGVARVA
ncbi:acyltransferase family protein [Methylobacterium sp. JK268]